MRIKLITALLMAGTVVGCASNPPPPPPMAMTPPPAPPPAPAPMGPVDGVYKGMADLAADAPASCAKMTRTQSVTVRKNMFALNGVRATIGPDGAVTAPTRRGMSVSGTANGGTLDLTSMRGKCSYHYVLNKA